MCVQVPIKQWGPYKQALTSASGIARPSTLDSVIDSYERAEFLGDAVVEATICQLLADRFPEVTSTGRLRAMQFQLVAGTNLYRLAMMLELDKFVATLVPVRAPLATCRRGCLLVCAPPLNSAPALKRTAPRGLWRRARRPHVKSSTAAVRLLHTFAATHATSARAQSCQSTTLPDVDAEHRGTPAGVCDAAAQTRAPRLQVMRDNGALRHELLADTVEALLAAMLADHGLAYASAWLSSRLKPLLNLGDTALGRPHWNHLLLEHCRENGLEAPRFRVHRYATYADPFSRFETRTTVAELEVNGQARPLPQLSPG